MSIHYNKEMDKTHLQSIEISCGMEVLSFDSVSDSSSKLTASEALFMSGSSFKVISCLAHVIFLILHLAALTLYFTRTCPLYPRLVSMILV
jgi:hypothetical protein